jgi:CTP:molybdopterin cytidylyltransferase MocA
MRAAQNGFSETDPESNFGWVAPRRRKPRDEGRMSQITAIILAAGDSVRMGGFPKALLPLGTETFLTRILGTLALAEISSIRVVLGAHASRIRPLLDSCRMNVLVNPDPERGQISSLKLGLENLDPACRGAMIWPVDQPLVSPCLVRGLVQLFEHSATQLALPRCNGKSGHPAIFGRALIQDLMDEPMAASPKPVVDHYKNEAAWLDTGEAGTVEDIDTPDDYFRSIGETFASALARVSWEEEQRGKGAKG